MKLVVQISSAENSSTRASRVLLVIVDEFVVNTVQGTVVAARVRSLYAETISIPQATSLVGDQ